MHGHKHLIKLLETKKGCSMGTEHLLYGVSSGKQTWKISSVAGE